MPAPLSVLLLTPLRDPRALAAAADARADALLVDLGDPAMPDARAACREAAASLLRRAGDGFPPVLVRVAPVASGQLDGDLDAVAGMGLAAVLLPGAVGLADVEHLGAKLAVREAERGLPTGAIGIVAIPADTAAGALLLPTLARGAPRLAALGWNGGALASALGGLGPRSAPCRAARGALLLTAAAAGVPALDLGAGDLAAARRDGFTGRLARSPGEVAAVRAAFTSR